MESAKITGSKVILANDIVNYSRVLELCHPENRMCRKLSVRIKSMRTVNESNPLHKFALGVDVDVSNQKETGALDRKVC